MTVSKELYVGVGSTLIVASIPIVLVNSFLIFYNVSAVDIFEYELGLSQNAADYLISPRIDGIGNIFFTTVPGIIAGVAGITAGSLMIDSANKSEQ